MKENHSRSLILLLLTFFYFHAHSHLIPKNSSKTEDEKSLQTLDSVNFYLEKDTSRYNFYSKLFDEINFETLLDSNFRKIITGRTERLRKSYKYDEAIPILRRAVGIATIRKDTSSLALFYKLLSTHYYYSDNLDSTLSQLNRAYTLYEYLEDEAELGVINIRRARVAYTLGNHENALHFSFEALEQHKSADDQQKMAISYLQLGNTFQYLSNYEYAEKYFALAAAYFKNSDDVYGYNEVTSNLGVVDVTQEKYQEGIQKQKLSLVYWTENEFKIEAGEAYNSLVSAYLGLKLFDSSFYYNELARESFLEANYQNGLTITYLNEARVLFLQEKFNEALKSIKTADKISTENNYNSLADEINFELYKIYKELKNPSKSFFHLEKYVHIKDSLQFKPLALQSDAMNYQLAAEEAKWNQKLAEKRAKAEAIEGDQTKRQLFVTIAIAIFTLISLLVAIYFLIRNKRLNKKLSHQREIIGQELKQKEALLNEIHHRVKNNLQVVSSMLSLQTQYLSDNSLKQIIEDSKGRINSMSLIHESLYRKDDFKEAIFSSYIQNLIPRLVETYGTDESKIQLIMNLEPIKLSLDDSIPCGLIINEIVSNSLKHGFPNGKQGTISIELKQKEKLVFLTISDDGVGLEEGKTFSSNDSFGFLLIESLASQLEAEIKIDSKGGFRYSLAWENNHTS
jgi:two-component sensor histidine kinase